MPARSADTPRTRLLKSASEAAGVYNQLNRLIAQQVRIPGQSAGRVTYSQPPWNATVAFSYFELHQLARDLEGTFRRYAGQEFRERGGSNENTLQALRAICRYTEAVPEPAVIAADRDLDRWLCRAKVVLGELELPQRLPRLPGSSEPVCPFCKRRSLRMFPLRGVVACIMPCKDDEGRKPQARMEFSKFTQNFELVWQDNIVGVPV